MTVPITNLNSSDGEMGVTRFPVGGDSGDSQFLNLAPQATGSVTLTGVAAGQYTVEAFDYTAFTRSESGPFTVIG